MEQPHQHGPQCKHGHGGHGSGHGHGHGGQGPRGPSDISPKQYFEKVKQMKQKNVQFYWMQILTGNYFNKYCQMQGLDIIRSLNCQVITMIVAQAQMMFTCQWLPLYLRPLISGMFFPLVFMLFFNFNVIYGVSNPDFTLLHLFSYLSIAFYILTALRQAGTLTTIQNLKKSQQAIRQRAYLQNANANCQQCKILKLFRSFHCPICKVCVSKFTRHSLAFGGCIGSSNQLLAWGFFTSLSITELLTLAYFFSSTQYGIITNIMFYALNVYIFWSSFVQSATLFIMNFWYGITQHQLRMWMMNQYLMKVPERQFCNSVGKGFISNLTQSFYSLFKISGFESAKKQESYNPMQQQIPISGKKQFEKLDPKKVYLVNWSKAFFYLTPQIPSHPSRDRVIQIMMRQEPKMLEMYQLQKRFREEIVKETQGQNLNQFQINQKVAMKMQQHMMKNQPQMMQPQQMMQPNPAQQKMMLIQMLTHMANQLIQKQPQIAKKIEALLKNVQQDKTSPMQANVQMRQIQQQLMKKQMQTIMKARELQQKQKNKQIQIQQQTQDEETQLKKQQAELPDEDL